MHRLCRRSLWTTTDPDVVYSDGNFSPGIVESWKSFFFHKFWIWRMNWFGVQTCELRWNWPKVEALKISRRTFVRWKQKIVVLCLSVISWIMHDCGWQKRLKHLVLWRIIVLKLKHYNLWCLVGKPTGYFFASIWLYRTLKKSKRTVGSPARTTKVRLRGQREIGGFLLNLLCKDESPDVPWKLNTHSSGTFLFGRAFDCTPWSPSGR